MTISEAKQELNKIHFNRPGAVKIGFFNVDKLLEAQKSYDASHKAEIEKLKSFIFDYYHQIQD